MKARYFMGSPAHAMASFEDLISVIAISENSRSGVREIHGDVVSRFDTHVCCSREATFAIIAVVCADLWLNRCSESLGRGDTWLVQNRRIPASRLIVRTPTCDSSCLHICSLAG
jgi:hypothetical protein